MTTTLILLSIWPGLPLVILCYRFGRDYYQHKQRMRRLNEIHSLRLKALWENRHGNTDEAFRLYDEAAQKLDAIGQEILKR